MDNKDIQAGHKFASSAIEALRKIGAGDQPVLFYTSMMGTHLGGIVAHVGKEATLAMIDCLRKQIATMTFDDNIDG